MARRSKFLTQEIEWAQTSTIVVVEPRPTGWKLHQFEMREGRLYGLDKNGKWVSCGQDQWRRRLNLLFKPPEGVTLFQAIRENGKWRAARKPGGTQN